MPLNDPRLPRPTPRVAVIVVNFNGGSLLDRCLTALAAQTRQPTRTIVVDNASSDLSAAGLEGRHPEVQAIRMSTNVGFAAASNLAVAEARDCDWVALVNPDVFPEPTWLAHLMEAAAERPEFASFGCRLVSATEATRMDGTGDMYHVSGLAWRRDHGRMTSAAASAAGEVFAPCAAAALYRRDVFLETGGFDEHFFCYFEDVDLGFRLRLQGHRCWYVPEAVVSHCGSAVTGRHSDFSVYHGHRNLVWTYLKNMPESLFWFYLPQHLLLNLIAVVWFSAQGQARAIVSAKAHSMRELPRVWKQRRLIQSTRRLAPAELRRLMVRGWLTPYLRRVVSG
jgi:GT2 family glycosyltransferase